MIKAMSRRAIFNEERQLHLEDRKIIATRLCILKAKAKAKEKAKENVKAKAKRRQASFNEALFEADANTSLNEILGNSSGEDEASRLDHTLQAFHDRLHRRLLGSDGMSEAIREVGEFASAISCSNCANRKDRWCQGRFSDKKLFVDPEHGPHAGQCVAFVRDLVETFLEAAEHHIGLLPDPTHRRPGPTHVRLVMEGLGPIHDGTLPIDGQFAWDGESDEAEITIKWPGVGQDYRNSDLAILVLPYLIFHELFVHGGQGRAAPQPVSKVENDCVFTEGLVDAVARELLLTRVFASPRWLPEVFQELVEECSLACDSYHKERSEKPELGSESWQRSKEFILKEARAEGWALYRKLQRIANQVGGAAGKPDDVAIHSGQENGRWSLEDCVTLMNLQFPLDHRERFVQVMQGVVAHNHLEVNAIFFEYSEQHRDPDRLLRSLECVVGFS